MPRPSLRSVLSLLAIAGLAVAAWLIFGSQPDRVATVPQRTPPTAPPGLANGVVAGSGVVEPSSEIITAGVVVPGLVIAVPVRIGDRVSKGTVLMRLDDRDVRAAVGERQAAVTYAERALAVARVDLAAADRQLTLYTSVEDKRAIAEQQLIDRRAARDAAAARVALAQADIGRARSQLETARVEVGRRVIRAPRSGEVLQIRTRPGQYATTNDTALIAMGETQPLNVRVDIDESEIPRLDTRAAAIISPRGDSGRRVRATLVRVEPQIIPKRSLTNAATERVDVRVMQRVYQLPAATTGFFVGQQVDAFVPAVGK